MPQYTDPPAAAGPDGPDPALALSIRDVIGRFPTFRVGVVAARDLRIAPDRPPELEALIRSTEEEAGAALATATLADLPEVRAWREAYKAFGVKKTSYRSSVERLLKRVQQGGGLPRVNALVDAYNLVSLRYRMPVGADDLDRVAPPLAFRFARAGDSFVRLGDEERSPDPPQDGEVVYADAEKCLCRRWNWYQDARSAIAAATTGAVLTVQAVEPAAAARVEEAVAALCELLSRHCAAVTTWAVADGARPEVSLPLA